MLHKDQQQFWHNNELDVNLMHAFYVDYAYPPHSHDYYVIALIEWGMQTFIHHRTKYITPQNGLILINPGVIHTGEAATRNGFQIRSIYPTTAHMEMAVYALTGRHRSTPYFCEVRVDEQATIDAVYQLHQALSNDAPQLACDSFFLTTLIQLVRKHGDLNPTPRRLGNERQPIKRAKQYIEANFAENIPLTQLAQYVGLSPYYLLRVFHAEVGIPPHAYLQDVRIRRAQSLIQQGRSLADVAISVGFSSQSHLTRRFKQFMGITPGQYIKQIQPTD